MSYHCYSLGELLAGIVTAKIIHLHEYVVKYAFGYTYVDPDVLKVFIESGIELPMFRNNTLQIQ